MKNKTNSDGEDNWSCPFKNFMVLLRIFNTCLNNEFVLFEKKTVLAYRWKLNGDFPLIDLNGVLNGGFDYESKLSKNSKIV